MEDATLFRPHLRAASASDNSSDLEPQGYEPIVAATREMSPPGPPPIGHERRQPTAMSYYSASDIPEPEAIPPINPPQRPAMNLHPSSAEQRRLDKPKPSPLSTSRTTSSPTALSPTSPAAISPARQTSSPTRLSPGGAQGPSGEYEMQLRPQHTYQQSYHSHTSRGSFVTADDGGWQSDNDDGATIQQHGR